MITNKKKYARTSIKNEENNTQRGRERGRRVGGGVGEVLL